MTRDICKEPCKLLQDACLIAGKVKELEKENAELKADNDARKFAMAMSEKVEKQLREQIEKMKGKHKQEILDLVLSNSSERAELEQKLEQTEKDLADYQFNYPKIKELEQTNNKLLDVINNQDVKIADLEKQIEQIEKVSDYNVDQLTKAKVIISAFVEWANWEGSKCPSFKSIQDKAEQFLKEIEKWQ